MRDLHLHLSWFSSHQAPDTWGARVFLSAWAKACSLPIPSFYPLSLSTTDWGWKEQRRWTAWCLLWVPPCAAGGHPGSEGHIHIERGESGAATALLGSQSCGPTGRGWSSLGLTLGVPRMRAQEDTRLSRGTKPRSDVSPDPQNPAWYAPRLREGRSLVTSWVNPWQAGFK